MKRSAELLAGLINKINITFYSKLYARRFLKFENYVVTVTGKLFLLGKGKIYVGKGCFFRTSNFNRIELYVADEAEVRIGNNVFINQGARISSVKKITIGDNVLMGDECIIYDTDWHGVGNEPPKIKEVKIGNNCWIAARCIVLKGVTIGDNSVIGAGAVVTKDIPPNSFAAGVPAKVMRKIESWP